VKVLLDQKLESTKQIAPITKKHEVQTAYEMGWATLDDGDLLKKAESAGFEIMVSCDQNLAYQQSLSDCTGRTPEQNSHRPAD
jgi:hypothetical protein